jgi:hypothetical protein
MAIRNLGTPDPTRKTSPVVNPDALEDELLSDEDAVSVPICYFNDEAFEAGSHVRSGGVLLRCEQGVWKMASAEDEQRFL